MNVLQHLVIGDGDVMMNDNPIDNNLANFMEDRITLVDDTLALISHCNVMKRCSWIAIDAEIHGGNTHCAEKTLIQTWYGSQINIIPTVYQVSVPIPCLHPGSMIWVPYQVCTRNSWYIGGTTQNAWYRPGVNHTSQTLMPESSILAEN